MELIKQLLAEAEKTEAPESYVLKGWTDSSSGEPEGYALFKGSKKVLYVKRTRQDRKMGTGALVYAGDSTKFKKWGDGKWDCESTSSTFSDEWKQRFEEAGIPVDFAEAMRINFGFETLALSKVDDGGLPKDVIKKQEAAIKKTLRGAKNIEVNLEA